jgi:hypothetical protein
MQLTYIENLNLLIELLAQLLDGGYKNQDLYYQLNALISIILELNKTNVYNNLPVNIDFGYNLDNSLIDLIDQYDLLIKTDNDPNRENFYDLVEITIKNAAFL